MSRTLQCGPRVLDLSSPAVMGIVNVTPDSFSDGGHLYRDNSLALDVALKHASDMVAAGAAIIDVGGESTRPGADPVGLQEEVDRVLPLVERIVAELDVIVSVDTSSPALMLAAADMGAGLINDVRALQREGAIEAAVKADLPVCLMHMQGEPKTMQANPSYDDVFCDIEAFFVERLASVHRAGISKEKVLLDPGYGFGKTAAHNLLLLKEQEKLLQLGCPLLVGLSRKSLIEHVLNRKVDQRLAGSLALAMLAVQNGASILRVHDVAETVDVIKMLQAVTEIGLSQK